MLKRSTPLTRKTPLKATKGLTRTPFKRRARFPSHSVAAPRSQPMKSRGMKGRPVSADQQRFWDLLVTNIGCVASRMDGFFDSHCSIHHIDGRTKPDAHWLVLPLSAGNHQDGTGVAGRIAVHPWKTRFEERYGRQRDLLVWCIEQLQAQGLEVPDGALRAAGVLEQI